MRVQLKKRGNSASIRIPESIMAAAAFCPDQEVEVRAETGRVVIEPISAPAYSMNALVDQMQPDSLPDDIDFGRPLGEELW